VNEFCAEFDVMIKHCIVEGEHAPANAITSLENFYSKTGARKFEPGGQSGGSGPND
jgi:hypothetical protein